MDKKRRSMDEYEITRKHYDEHTPWHHGKFLAYGWNAQVGTFTSMLGGKRVLDVGCGTGGWSKALAANGLDVVGIDYSEATIAMSKKHVPNATFHVANMLELSSWKEHFDGVWAQASLLNLKKKDIPSVLHEFHRLLNPQGILYVAVKEGEGERMVKDLYGERFFSFFTDEEMQSFIEQQGFTILKKERLVHENYPPTDPPSFGCWLLFYAQKQ